MIQLFARIPSDIGSARRRPKNTIKPILSALREAGVTLCEDSIRRRAVRLGLMEANGAKYVAPLPKRMWTRPCMICKSTSLRPVNQYVCDVCKGRVHD